MELNKKQILVFVGWVVFICVFNWLASGHFLESVLTACASGVLGLSGIFLIERYIS